MNSLKKFFSNKNTVTILGVIVCVIILFIGYTYRINSQVELIVVPYAKETIDPKTKITKDMVGKMKVPASFIQGKYYSKKESVIGKYSSFIQFLEFNQGLTEWGQSVSTANTLTFPSLKK